MNNFFERQNHQQALTYLRAAYYCERKKRRLSVRIIFLPIIMTLISIFNGIMTKIIPNPDSFEFLGYNLNELSEILAKFIIILSGILIIFEVFVKIKIRRLDLENANFLERFDNYVFDFPANEAYLHPIPEQTAQSYAHKTPKRRSFKNYYFDSEQAAEEKNACFNNLKDQFEFEYKLMMYIKPVFVFIWIAYCLFLLVMAFMLDFKIQDAIINIFIPALSTISVIIDSWFGFNEKVKDLSAINMLITKIENGVESKMAINSQSTLRSLQDALFSYRINDFYVPRFLVWKYERHAATSSWRDREGLPNKIDRKTEKENTRAAAEEIKKKNPHRAKKAQAQTKKPQNRDKTATSEGKKVANNDKKSVTKGKKTENKSRKA